MKVLLVVAAVLIPLASARLPYIVGGRDATPGKWPWQASLQKYGGHVCGASLISSRWLVTASHCLGGHASQYSVVLGAHDIRTQRQGQPRRYYISRYIMHPRFEYSSSKFFPNDIALLYTSSNVDTYSKYAAAVPMASQNEKFVGNSNCYITGWGRTSSGSPNILQETQVRVISDSDCGRYVRPLGGYHICVRSTSNRASGCNGDSGGPLVCNVGGRWELAGAFSFMWGCSPQYPSVYADVGYFRNWIKQNSGV